MSYVRASYNRVRLCADTKSEHMTMYNMRVQGSRVGILISYVRRTGKERYNVFFFSEDTKIEVSISVV